MRRCAQVVNELDNCLSTIRAVCGLHTRGKTAFKWKQEDDELRYKLKSVGTARLAFFLFVRACRLTIACALCYGGSYFIAHTIGLGDLILNCVALEVCLSSPTTSTLALMSTDCGRAVIVFGAV